MTTRKRFQWLWSCKLPTEPAAAADVDSSAPAPVSSNTGAAMNESFSMPPDHVPPVPPFAQREQTSKAEPVKALPLYTYFQRSTRETAAKTDAWPAEAFWYTMLFMGCASAALILWGAYSALPRGANPGKLLRAEHTIPKLKGDMRSDGFAGQWALAKPHVAPPAPPAPDFAKVDLPTVPMAARAPAAPNAVLPALPSVPVAPVAAQTEPVRLAPPPPALPTKIEPPMVELPRTTQPAPITQASATIPAMPLYQGPLVFVNRANLGDTPMLRTWKTLALYSLLAMSPVAVPATAAAQAEDPKLQKRLDTLEGLLNDTIKSINGVSKGIEGMKSDLASLQTDIAGLRKASLLLRNDVDGNTTRVDNLEKLVGNLTADVKYLRQRLNEAPGPLATQRTDKVNLEDLQKQLASIEQAIMKLRPGTDPGSSRIALAPPAATGRVILANMYHEDMLFVINQKTHRVAPGAVLPLESIPAGNLTYEVLSPTWGLRARNTTNLPANETFTLTAR